MSTTRSEYFARPMLLASVAAFVLGLPLAVATLTTSPASAETSASSTVTMKNKRSAADEQKEFNEHLQKITKRLKLNADQAAKVKAIMVDQMAQKTALKARYKDQAMTADDKATMDQAKKALHADTDARLAKVLTADQMAEYSKMRAEKMKKHEHAKEEKAEEAKESK